MENHLILNMIIIINNDDDGDSASSRQENCTRADHNTREPARWESTETQGRSQVSIMC